MTNSRPLVLIVDDEPDMCWVLKNLLGEDDFALRIAQTAEAALKFLESESFSIALLDAKLTDMDGLDLARRIKAIDPWICIVMVSGYYYKDDVDIRAAMDNKLIVGFIAKPFVHSDVIEMLNVCRQTRWEHQRPALEEALGPSAACG